MTVRALPQGIQRAARLLSALVLAGAVLLATVFAGRTYSWCLLTQQVCSDACASDGCDDTHEGEQGPVVHTPCCEDRALDDLPCGAQREGLPAVPATPVAILPAAPSPLALGSFHQTIAPHARPLAPRGACRFQPPAAAERCAVLQVFRC